MMSALMLSEIARETGGQLSGDARITAVTTDSRNVCDGDLFIALTGERFDGNDFVGQVAEQGAAAAILSKDCPVEIPTLQVNDTRLALGIVARINRRRFKGPLIALTGSAGKTTCKEMIAAILGQCGETLATEANFNNEIGVPRTLLKLAPQHAFAVIEMGASRADDIRYLTQFAEPTIGLVTNAMAAHIEGFGSLDGVAQTKGQVFESVADGGTAIINIDDAFADQWRRQAGKAAIVTFSLENGAADFFASDVVVGKGGETVFTLHTPEGEIEIGLSFLGRHNVLNAIAAAAASAAAGARLNQIKAGLEQVKPVQGRLCAYAVGDRVVIDDTYNANPGAVKAAIDVLMEFPGTHCLILGAMAELGEDAQQAHDAIAAYAKSSGIEQLVLVGDYAAVSSQIYGTGLSRVDDLLPKLNEWVSADVVLVKGSRSAKMERVVDALIHNHKEREKS